MMNILTQIGNFFGAIYNFIQTNPFFAKNIFNFLVVIAFFIWLLFFKLDVVGLLEKKSQETQATIKDAEDKKISAIKHYNDTKEALKNVDNDVKDIVNNAKEVAKNIEESSKSKLNSELENLETRTKVLEKNQTNKVKEEISQTVANAAVAISEEYIKNSLDEQTHKELIYNFINDLENVGVN